MNRLWIFALLLLFAPSVFSQHCWNGNQLVIQNDKISRVVVFDNGTFSTQSFRIKDYPNNFVSISNKEPVPFTQQNTEWIQNREFRRQKGPNPEEFSFLLNGKKVTGKTGWKVVDVREKSTDNNHIYSIVLNGTSEINEDLEVEVTYVIYPGLPIIRKRLDLKNTGSGDVKIESLDVESLNIPWGNTHNVVYHDYGRYKHIGPFLGNWNDPLVISHDPDFNYGIVIGNEAPGVLKRTSVCLSDGRTLSAGMTHADQDFAFRKWLQPGEKWSSTWIFAGLYAGKNPEEFVEGPVSDYVRKYMGIRLAEISRRPTFVYNTWKPFRREVNEKLVKELADAAAAGRIW